MLDESDLVTQFHNIRWDAEILAIKSLHNVEVPICGFLSQLTSSDCLKLLKYESQDWLNLNYLLEEKILLNFLITDYISCGLSSPAFHVEFHRTLQAETSKIKLFKGLIYNWNVLFKQYKITSLNINFIKNFVVSLDRLFNKISNSVSGICVTWECTKVINRLKQNIAFYEKNHNDPAIFPNDNNVQLDSCAKKNDSHVENTVLKKLNESQINISVKRLINQKLGQKSQYDEGMKCNPEPSNDHLSKKSKLMSSGDENANSESTAIKSPSSEPKLNAFQIMMLNAKKQKGKTK